MIVIKNIKSSYFVVTAFLRNAKEGNILSEIIIKRVEKESIKALAEVANEIWHEYFTPIIGLQQVEYMVDKFQSVQGITNQLENGYEYYFVIYNDEIAGYFGIQLQSDSLFLSKLYLKKDFRGKGISSQMLEYIKNIACNNSKGRIMLTVNRYNYHTIDIYKHFGVEIEKEQKADIGNGFFMDDYAMTLYL